MAHGDANKPTKDLTECPMVVDKAPNGTPKGTNRDQNTAQNTPGGTPGRAPMEA